MRSSRNAALRRLVLVVLAPALAFGWEGARAAEEPAPPYTQTEYWALADSMMAGLDPLWNESRRAYAEGRRTASVRMNSAMLLTHSIAALRGHAGPTRRDARARVLADRLSATPAWLGGRSVAKARGGKSTCWGLDMDRAFPGHPSLESKVAAALASAWRARRAIGLPAGVARRIQARVAACASSPTWIRGPRVENQINWNAEMYASAVTVSGTTRPLVSDYRRQLATFAAGITSPMAGQSSPNLGPGYQFRYRPRLPGSAPVNLDSPEYANITIDAISHYDRALRLGMRPLGATSIARMRAWSARLLAGAWTHAGYLNWDTGHGVKRWHSAQYWAFSQQGLLALATSPRFRTSEEGRWAKALFDRGLDLHRQLAAESASGVAPRRMFGVRSLAENHESYLARMLSNVARAIEAGLGSLPAQDPPPLYSFDHDTGRLAITTPHYSTAILPDNRGVFEYGGVDPARLFAAGQRVAANLGGTPPATFGIVVRGNGGGQVLASQNGRTARGALRLVRSPRGVASRPASYPDRPHAGPFASLEAHGLLRRGSLSIRSAHRFETRSITSRWRVSCAPGCAGRRITGHFPTTGAGATIEALTADGTVRRIAGPGARRETDIGGVARLRLRSAGGGGYDLVPVSVPAGTRLSSVRVPAQATNPRPGPTLVMELPFGRRSTATTLGVRIEPVAGGRD